MLYIGIIDRIVLRGELLNRPVRQCAYPGVRTLNVPSRDTLNDRHPLVDIATNKASTPRRRLPIASSRRRSWPSAPWYRGVSGGAKEKSLQVYCAVAFEISYISILLRIHARKVKLSNVSSDCRSVRPHFRPRAVYFTQIAFHSLSLQPCFPTHGSYESSKTLSCKDRYYT